MTGRRSVLLRYGRDGLELRVPQAAEVLVGTDPPALVDVEAAVRHALEHPTGSAPLRELVAARGPRSVAIAIADGTRPAPSARLLSPLLEVLSSAGVPDSSVTVVVGTGMHRPSTEGERVRMVGEALLSRLRVVDHRADAPETLTELSRDPPLRVNREFALADLRIVTGLIEPHFMAGFSGGCKGVCPALTDLATIGRFHSYDTLADPRAAAGVLEGNPCRAIALEVTRRVGVDFLLNVALTRDVQVAGVYAGDLELAHAEGCRAVRGWASAAVQGTYDLVITSGGGHPLDHTFYQAVKGQVGALPALGPGATLLQVSECAEGLGSPAYARQLREWGPRWREFLAELARERDVTRLDQWELQMQCRVLARVGVDGLWFVSDGVAEEDQRRLAVRAVLGEGPARVRAQRAIDGYLAGHPGTRVAVIPDGPYTLLTENGSPGG